MLNNITSRLRYLANNPHLANAGTLAQLAADSAIQDEEIERDRQIQADLIQDSMDRALPPRRETPENVVRLSDHARRARA